MASNDWKSKGSKGLVDFFFLVCSVPQGFFSCKLKINPDYYRNWCVLFMQRMHSVSLGGLLVFYT